MLTTLLLVALAQVAQPEPAQWSGGSSRAPYGISDFTSHGRGLPAWAPAPTVALDGAAYKPGDATWVGQGATMTKVGSPLAWYGSPFYPDGFGESEHPGVYIDTGNRYAFPTASDPMDVGTFTVVEVISGADLAVGEHEVYRNGTYASAGAEAWHTGTAFSAYVQTSTGPKGVSLSNAMSAGTVVRCWGADIPGGLIVANVNGAETANVSVTGTYVSGSGNIAVLGNSAYPAKSTLHEFMFTTTPVSLAGCRALVQQVMSCRTHPCVPEDANTVSHVTFSGSGVLSDSKGHAWVKTGSPVASSPTYVWPGNRTPLAQPAAYLTSGNVWSGGNIFGAPNEFTIRHKFKVSDISGANYLIGKYGSAGWLVYVTGGVAIMRACAAGPTCSNTSSFGSVEANAWYVLSVSYRYSATEGTTVRANLNGVATTTTGFVGPILDDVSFAFMLGQFVTGSQTVASSEAWSGWAASASELDLLTRDAMGLTTEKPAGVAIPFARNDSHSACCPISDASCHKLGANMPCITRRGIERAGPTSNLLATSVDIGSWVTWSPGHVAPVRTSNTTETTDPTGGNTAAKIVFPAVGAGQISLLVSPQFAQTATPYAFGLWAKVPSGTWRTYLSCYSTGYYAIREVTITPTWQRLSTTGTSPGSATQSCSIGTDLNAPAPGETPTDAGTVYLWAGQANASGVLLPYRASAGTPYSGPATDISIARALLDPSRWAISISYYSTGGWGVADRFWSLGNNANSAYLAGGYLGIFDATNTQLYSFVSPILPTGEHTATVYYRSPAATLSVDGVARSLSFTGSGSGVLSSLQSSIVLGGGLPYDHIRRVVQCPTERNCR